MAEYPNIQVQPQYYQFEPSSVERQLWGELRSNNDRPLLHAIFLSPEWKSQCAPIDEDFIRQLRHLLPLQSGPIYACPFCTVIEREANHMTEHIQMHFGLRPYHCPECGHTSLRKSDMQGHIKTHSPQEIYCPQGCGQSFSSSKNIKRHVEKSCPLSAV